MWKYFYKIRGKLPAAILKQIYFAFVHPYLLYGIELYANTAPTHMNKLIVLNNKLLRILQHKTYSYPVKRLYHNYNTLPIPDLFYFQLSLLVCKYVHCKQTLPTSFINYFTMNNMI